MSPYPLQSPDELMQQVRQLAEVNQVPPEQWLIAAIAQQAQQSLTHLRDAAQRAEVERFDHILARVPNIPPIPGDELE